jgi:hypothetical protein
MDHVEQEIHQVLSNHLPLSPSQSIEVFEQDEDFVIRQTKTSASKKLNQFFLQ